MITSVNFHLWEPCNMRCGFCFAKFQDVKNTILPKGHLNREDAIEVVQQLAEIGFEKITFAGGEPTLCPWLGELIKTAKDAGMVTMIVTNGTGLNEEFLKTNRLHLDWIALSVDSLNDATNISAGRAITGKTAVTKPKYYELVDRIKFHGYGLKINTVVHAKNHLEDMSGFLAYAKPKRWKVLKVLPMKEQNDKHIQDFVIDEEKFQQFIERHAEMKQITTVVPETNRQMKGTYAMVDPAGRFYDNTNGVHNYSQPIINIGARLAIQQVNYSFSGFVERGGIYSFQRENHFDKITISGEVASGKTTVGKLLAKELGFGFVSLGDKVRETAAKENLHILEFQKKCLENPAMDKVIDQEFSKECNEGEKLIIDYRLGFHFIPRAYHIFLAINETLAIERLKNAGRVNETHDTVKQRNETFRDQFKNTYQVDIKEEKHYDLIIDVEIFNSPEEVAKHIISSLKLIK